MQLKEKRQKKELRYKSKDKLPQEDTKNSSAFSGQGQRKPSGLEKPREVQAFELGINTGVGENIKYYIFCIIQLVIMKQHIDSIY